MTMVSQVNSSAVQRYFIVWCVAGTLGCMNLSALAQSPASEWVNLNNDGGLSYKTCETGDRIPDFSMCGYMGGGVALPGVPVKMTLSPVAGDNRARVQEAIDTVSEMAPDGKGFRGAILLKRGTYHIGDTLRIAASGVVLRGEGQGANGTVLLATKRERHDLIRIQGSGRRERIEDATRRIVDDYVPVGATRFRLESTEGLSVGDTIVVERPSTAEWISAIGMDRIHHTPGTLGKGEQQWRPGKYNLRLERVITDLEGQTIEIDAPVVNSCDQRYGGGWVYRYRDEGRLERCGIENLRGDSVFDPEIRDPRHEYEYADEDHAWKFVVLRHADNCWVRDVTAIHFGYACVEVQAFTRHITVQDCANLEPVSRVTGARRYSFGLKSTLALVQRCFAERGRHDYVMHSRAPGPNVFLDCLATHAFNDSGPHHRWSVGTLYDNLRVEGHTIRIQDRGDWGSAHGWAGANQVLWNCEATGGFVVQSPPTAQNWAIGCVGPKARPRLAGRPEGIWDTYGTHVTPRSLYHAQLKQRLGKGALEKIRTDSQRNGTIYSELKSYVDDAD